MSGSGALKRPRIIRPSNPNEATHALRHPGLSRRRGSHLVDSGRGRGADARSEQGSRPPHTARGPAARLGATKGACVLRGPGAGVVIDGPFTETKEQLLSFYL